MTRIAVRVQPGARRNAIERVADGALRVRVTSPPERGRANEAVLELLADALDVPKSRLSIVRGHRARQKVVEVEGLTDDELERRVSELS